ADFLREEIVSDAKVAYAAREAAIGSENMRELERRVVLSVIGRKWQEHPYEMDYLKEGIGLRAMAQRDPLVEYQREGYTLFQAMMESIREESIGYLFNLEVKVEEPAPVAWPGVADARKAVQHPHITAAGLEAPPRPAALQFTAPTERGGVETHVERQRGAAAPAGNPEQDGGKDGGNGSTRSQPSRKARRRK
ncbi:preprotein translocase subunit SecA, partial [Arthrobacter deserti]|nr:preprotein translocase subunit SecA [Arthrobacter deserti]